MHHSSSWLAMGQEYINQTDDHLCRDGLQAPMGMVPRTWILTSIGQCHLWLRPVSPSLPTIACRILPGMLAMSHFLIHLHGGEHSMPPTQVCHIQCRARI